MKFTFKRSLLAGAAMAWLFSSAWAADTPPRQVAAAKGCQQMQGVMGEMGGAMGHMSRQRMRPGVESTMSGHMTHMHGMMGEMSKMMDHCGNMSEAEMTRMQAMHKEMRELRSKVAPPLTDNKAP